MALWQKKKRRNPISIYIIMANDLYNRAKNMKIDWYGLWVLSKFNVQMNINNFQSIKSLMLADW